MVDQQFPESDFVHVAVGQGLVEAAVRSSELRLEAEGGH
jgi:hypothetical protein